MSPKKVCEALVSKSCVGMQPLDFLLSDQMFLRGHISGRAMSLAAALVLRRRSRRQVRNRPARHHTRGSVVPVFPHPERPQTKSLPGMCMDGLTASALTPPSAPENVCKFVCKFWLAFAALPVPLPLWRGNTTTWIGFDASTPLRAATRAKQESCIVCVCVLVALPVGRQASGMDDDMTDGACEHRRKVVRRGSCWGLSLAWSRSRSLVACGCERLSLPGSVSVLWWRSLPPIKYVGDLVVVVGSNRQRC